MMMNVVRHRLWGGIVLLAALTALSVDVASPAQSQPLTPQTNSAGMVTIKATPQALSASAAPWRFEIVMDTHSVALTQDLREAAVLSGGEGSEQKPIAWEGDPPGGHHRKGVLVFAPIDPLPRVVALRIRGVAGVPERTFTWTVSP